MVRFSATLGEEPEIEVGLVGWLCARDQFKASRVSRQLSEVMPLEPEALLNASRKTF